MSEHDTEPAEHTDPQPPEEAPHSRVPTVLALLLVAVVWVLGCVWSFTEQTAFAAAKGFIIPELLPLILDGMAMALAGVAYAAALDGRPAIGARLGTAVAIGLSATSNGIWASERSQGDPVTIGLAITAPVTAMLAFEVLLGELRRQVQRRRGEPAPTPIPFPRLLRLVLSPGPTLREWRRLVLALTALPTPPAPGRATAETSNESNEPTVATASLPPAPVEAEPVEAAPVAAPSVEAPAAQPEPDTHTTAETTPSTEATETAASSAETSSSAPAHREPNTTTMPLAAVTPLAPSRSTETAAHTPAPQLTTDDERVQRILPHLIAGEELTGEQVGAMFGLSDRSGRRILENAREQLRRSPRLHAASQ